MNPNDTLVWYDSENPSNVAFPSNFTYKSIKNWTTDSKLKLSKVVLNTSSGDISSVSPSLPSSQGTFNATLQKEGNNPPTMDLYFQGEIITEEGNWDIDEHSYCGWNVSKISITFNSAVTNYNLNQSIEITYNCEPGFDKGYIQSQFYIRFTANWGKNASNNYIYIQSQNSHGTVTLPKPTTMIDNIDRIIPTITVSGRVYSQVDPSYVPEPEEVAYIEEYYRRGRATVGIYVRSGPGTEYDYVASIISGFEFEITAKATRYDNGQVWYYAPYDGGYVYSGNVEIV